MSEGLFVLGTWVVCAGVGFFAGWLRGTLAAKCVACRLAETQVQSVSEEQK